MADESWRVVQQRVQNEHPGFALFAVFGYEGMSAESHGLTVDGTKDPTIGNGKALAWVYHFAKDAELISALYFSNGTIVLRSGTLPTPVIPISSWTLDSDDAIVKASPVRAYMAAHSGAVVSYGLTEDFITGTKSTLWIIGVRSPDGPFFQVVVNAVTGVVET